MSEQIRAEFEKWWHDSSTNKRLTDMREEKAFYIWQAARARYAGSGEIVACVCGDMFPQNSYDAGWINAVGCCPNCHVADHAGSESEETIQRLRGQLQNCVNHIERLKRHHPRETDKLDACVQSANKCLYETLHGISPPAQPKVPEQLTVSQCSTSEYCKGWNDCREAMLSAQENISPAPAVPDEVFKILKWYRKEADTLRKNYIVKDVKAVSESVQGLATDSGSRADKAIAMLTQAKGGGMKQLTDSDRIDFIQNSLGGHALLSDDNGHWSVSFGGMQNVPEGHDPEFIATTFYVNAPDWKNSVREAIDAAMADDDDDEAQS